MNFKVIYIMWGIDILWVKPVITGILITVLKRVFITSTLLTISLIFINTVK